MLGERHVLIHQDWLSAAEIALWVSSLPLEANSGDIYAMQGSAIRDQAAIIRLLIPDP